MRFQAGLFQAVLDGFYLLWGGIIKIPARFIGILIMGRLGDDVKGELGNEWLNPLTLPAFLQNFGKLLEDGLGAAIINRRAHTADDVVWLGQDVLPDELLNVGEEAAGVVTEGRPCAFG